MVARVGLLGYFTEWQPGVGVWMGKEVTRVAMLNQYMEVDVRDGVGLENTRTWALAAFPSHAYPKSRCICLARINRCHKITCVVISPVKSPPPASGPPCHFHYLTSCRDLLMYSGCSTYKPGTKPSTVAFHSCGKCDPVAPSQPPAIMAMASRKELAPGK